MRAALLMTICIHQSTLNEKFSKGDRWVVINLPEDAPVLLPAILRRMEVKLR
jgi:hypothetical protein